MAWNSLRNNRTLPVINVQGGGDIITLPNGTITLLPHKTLGEVIL